MIDFLKLLFWSFFFQGGPKDDLPLFLEMFVLTNLLMAGAGYSHKPQDPKPLHLLIADFHM
jgi:hypothetical protein